MTAFLAAALVLAVTPGPGIFYVLARSLGEGTRVGVRSSLGTGLGGLCHVVAAALGLSTLLMTSATAFEVVRYAGACYLVFLGVRTLLGLREAGGGDAARARRRRLPPGRADRAAQPQDGALLPDLPAAVRSARARPRRRCSCWRWARSASRSTRRRTSWWRRSAAAPAAACAPARAGSGASARCRAWRSSRWAGTPRRPIAGEGCRRRHPRVGTPAAGRPPKAGPPAEGRMVSGR